MKKLSGLGLSASKNHTLPRAGYACLALTLFPFLGESKGWTEAREGTFSLFHTPQEMRKIKAQRHSHGDVVTDATIELSGIVYSSVDRWQIWVNGVVYTPQAFAYLQVVKVTPDAVSFRGCLGQKPCSDGKKIPFTLRLNQRFCLQEASPGQPSQK